MHSKLRPGAIFEQSGPVFRTQLDGCNLYVLVITSTSWTKWSGHHRPRPIVSDGAPYCKTKRALNLNVDHVSAVYAEAWQHGVLPLGNQRHVWEGEIEREERLLFQPLARTSSV